MRINKTQIAKKIKRRREGKVFNKTITESDYCKWMDVVGLIFSRNIIG